jgi:hypothetical protein
MPSDAFFFTGFGMGGGLAAENRKIQALRLGQAAL